MSYIRGGRRGFFYRLVYGVDIVVRSVRYLLSCSSLAK